MPSYYKNLIKNSLPAVIFLFLLSFVYNYSNYSPIYPYPHLTYGFNSLVFGIIFGMLFGYIKYSTEKDIKNSNYTIIKIIKKFLISFVYSIILIFISLFILSYKLRGSELGLAALAISFVAYWTIILITLSGGLYSLFLYLTRNKIVIRKYIYHSINLLLILLLVVLFSLNLLYKSNKSYWYCSRIEYTPFKIDCVVNYGLATKSPEPCTKVFNFVSDTYSCYKRFMLKGGSQFFNKNYCDNLNFKENKYIPELYLSRNISVSELIDDCYRTYNLYSQAS